MYIEKYLKINNKNTTNEQINARASEPTKRVNGWSGAGVWKEKKICEANHGIQMKQSKAMQWHDMCFQL